MNGRHIVPVGVVFFNVTGDFEMGSVVEEVECNSYMDGLCANAEGIQGPPQALYRFEPR